MYLLCSVEFIFPRNKIYEEILTDSWLGAFPFAELAQDDSSLKPHLASVSNACSTELYFKKNLKQNNGRGYPLLINMVY